MLYFPSLRTRQECGSPLLVADCGDAGEVTRGSRWMSNAVTIDLRRNIWTSTTSNTSTVQLTVGTLLVNYLTGTLEVAESNRGVKRMNPRFRRSGGCYRTEQVWSVHCSWRCAFASNIPAKGGKHSSRAHRKIRFRQQMSGTLRSNKKRGNLL